MNQIENSPFQFPEQTGEIFRVRLFQDGQDIVGHGVSAAGLQITFDVRISNIVPPEARLDQVETARRAVQGLLIAFSQDVPL